MLELVVADDLTPSLECPLCGRPYVRCSLPIPPEGPKCTSCGGSFRLPDLLPKQQRTDPAPRGVSVDDDGSNWTVDVSTRALKGALISAVSGVAVLACTVFIWMHGGWLFGGGDDSDSQMLRKLGLVLFVGSVALLVTAVWRFWGRYQVSVIGDLGTVFAGIGGIGSTRKFSPRGINGVCLTTAVSFDRNGNQIEKRVVRLEGVGFYMDLGEDLPDEQRAYLALFLLQKRVDSNRDIGTTAGA